MGFDCGFDIFPRLEPTDANKSAYEEFLAEIISTFQHAYDERGRREDGQVLQLPGDSALGSWEKHYIQFMVGECPRMPANPDRCDYFLRFSSKVSGGLTACAEPYIKRVCRIAKEYFGDRVQPWHEMNELGDPKTQWGYYDWSEVYEADKKLRALETEEGQDVGDHGLDGEDGNGTGQAGSSR